MAAPEIIIPTEFWASDNAIGEIVATYAAEGNIAVTYPNVSRRTSRFQNNNSSASIRWMELEFATPVDLTNAACFTCISRNGGSSGFQYVRFGLRSGPTPNLNYRDWNIDSATGSSNGDANYIDISVTPNDSGGTFDPSDVRAVRYAYVINENAFRIDQYSSPCFFDRDVGVQGRLGEPGNPVDIEFVSRYFIRTTSSSNPNTNSYLAQSSGTDIVSGTEQYYRIPHSVTLGDGVDSYIEIESAAIIFTGSTELNFKFGPRRCNIISNTPTDIISFSIIGDEGNGDSFYELSLFSNNYTEFFTRDLQDHILANSDYVGTFKNFNGTVFGGRRVILNLLEASSNILYEWNGTADLTDTNFNSPLANYGINFPNSLADNLTFDASGINFVSDVVTSKFRVDIGAGKTINILLTNEGQFTDSDVEVVSGSYQFTFPQPTISIVGFPTGSTIVLSQAGIQLDLINNATSPYSFVVGSQGETGDIYQFKVIAENKQDFFVSIDINETTSAPYLGLDESSEQTINENLFDFQELMLADAAFVRIANEDITINSQLWEVAFYRDKWNEIVVVDVPSTAEISAWIGYLTTIGYTNISFNSVTGEVS